MRRVGIVVLAVLTAACAGFQKDCSKMGASNFGSDWLVVQFDQTGHAFNCWKLTGAVVESSEGGNVDWKDTTDGHLVHITGWENRVQVERGNWESAAKIVGIDAAQCGNGRYPQVVK